MAPSRLPLGDVGHESARMCAVVLRWPRSAVLSVWFSLCILLCDLSTAVSLTSPGVRSSVLALALSPSRWIFPLDFAVSKPKVLVRLPHLPCASTCHVHSSLCFLDHVGCGDTNYTVLPHPFCCLCCFRVALCWLIFPLGVDGISLAFACLVNLG